ncbi:LOW QUALITY PROTEIN: DNA repair protein RAD5B-like [Salvia splendens]|uniref:LOW QUALITY PROTEIN: DNA repair protein RAD5B-like n=1 Tax=Salvia splendens TaxID=180675 RepID=UPI001C258A93|nr:LOW QUALITY PROTEIN: DNA repair protein RAD5B-like [Salvia splendens]
MQPGCDGHTAIKARTQENALSSVVIEDGDFPEELGWLLVGRTVITGLSTTKGRKLENNEIVHFMFPGPTTKNKLSTHFLSSKAAHAVSSNVRFSTKRYGEIGRLPMEWAKCLIPLVNSSKVKVLDRCVAAPVNLCMMQAIMLYVSFYIHESVFLEVDKSWKLEATNIDTTIYPLLKLFQLLKVRPFQKAQFTPEELDSRKRLLQLDENTNSIYHRVEWHRVVLDEAHTIKSSKTIAAKAAFALTSYCRWCLTGTPLQNNLEDLFILLCFLHVESWWNKLIQKPYDNAREGPVPEPPSDCDWRNLLVSLFKSAYASIRSSGSGEKSIVFSQRTSFLDLLEIPFKRKNIRFLRSDGKLAQKQRAKVLHEFAETAEKTVLLMSLKAGGVGLNLTAASNVFLMDPWWNPAVEEQAIMRIHRIGQKLTVRVRRFIVKDTVEQRLQQVQARKQRMIAGALTDEEVRSARIEELKMLFR